MNRLLFTAILTYLIIRLLLSCATYEERQTASVVKSPNEKDNSGINSPIKIDAFKLDIFPPSSGVQFYRDGIVYLSLSKNKGKMVPGHISFGNLQAYYSIVEDSVPGPRQVFSPTVSFPYPCEAITFSDDFNTMYFTRISEGDNIEKIYRAELSNENNQPAWKFDTEPLSFCSSGSAYSHPSVSSDGKTMIFASNNPKSIGGMDLFVTENVGGAWTEPKNIGDAVNSNGNELFPSLDNEKDLFFSSDGIPGKGGYDIFVSKYNGTGWEKAIDMPAAINSGNDEIAFSLNKSNGESAFFTSKNNSRNAGMQLFKVSLIDAIASSNLAGVLYSMALSQTGAEQLKITEKNLAADKLETGIIEAEKNRIAKLKADSLEAARLRQERTEAEKSRIAKLKADNLEAARINEQATLAERDRIARLKADSLAALKRLEAERTEAYNKANKDVVIYKVQYLSSVRSAGTASILVNGKNYKSSEYFYLGEYRYTIGEFRTLEEAKILQSETRKSGYTQAFVVAFKNNTRTNDPDLFK